MTYTRYQLVSAAATLGLVFFAGVQIVLEIWRRKDTRRSASIQARGPAWLARRILDNAVREIDRFPGDVRSWAMKVEGMASGRSLEANMLDALRLASHSGGRLATAAERAFDSHLAFMDRLTWLAAYRYSKIDSFGVSIPNEEDEANTSALFKEIVYHLTSSANSLAEIAPRQAHEPAVPKISTRSDAEGSVLLQPR